jgi:carbon storage regulator
MLLLTRKVMQTIVIGEGQNRVEVVVHRIRGGTVSIGITAPRSVKVLRGELQERGKEAA